VNAARCRCVRDSLSDGALKSRFSYGDRDGGSGSAVPSGPAPGPGPGAATAIQCNVTPSEMGTVLHVIPETDAEDVFHSRHDSLERMSINGRAVSLVLQHALTHTGALDERFTTADQNHNAYPFLDKNETERNDVLKQILNSDAISTALSAARKAIAANISLYSEHLQTGRSIEKVFSSDKSGSEAAETPVESQSESDSTDSPGLDSEDLSAGKKTNAPLKSVPTRLEEDRTSAARVQPATEGEDAIEIYDSMTGPRRLEVTIVRGRHLPKCDRFGTIDG
jgi:hypothetical protein